MAGLGGGDGDKNGRGGIIKMSYAAVGWRDHHLVLLDQRLLPHEERYLECGSAEETAQAIRTMVVRGAPAIGCAAAFGLAAEAYRLAAVRLPEDWVTALQPGYWVLRGARPTAVNLTWAVDRLWALVTATGSTSVPRELLPEQLFNAATTIFNEDVAACRAMGALGASLMATIKQHQAVQRPLVLMTHCNAGALATAGFGTALGVIRACRDTGQEIEVVATETRPLLQGARLTAWELVKEQIPTTLITDSMAGDLMARNKIDAVIVGADRVAGNGDVANKIGTYSHAILAKHHRIPFFVACPISTIDPALQSGAEIPVEMREGQEVSHWAGQQIAASGVRLYNPAFDITPAALVTALITEKGVVQPPNAANIATLLTDSQFFAR